MDTTKHNYRAAILLLALLAGCSQRPDYGTARGNTTNDPVVYLDRDTGCEYLATYADAESLTPRLGPDGRQVCRKVP